MRSPLSREILLRNDICCGNGCLNCPYIPMWEKGSKNKGCDCMGLYIRLNKEINPQKLLEKIHHEINEHIKSNDINDSILCIEIKNVSHIVDGCLIKLENTLEKLNDREDDLPK